MRFYAGAIKYLEQIDSDAEHQHLYLVQEVNSNHDPNAVMLHNGRQKLGNVSATEATKITPLFNEWKRKDGFDNVVICKMMKTSALFSDSRLNLKTIIVQGAHRVNERLARKFARKCIPG